MQVYAVIYVDNGDFLLGFKLPKGYFFHDPKNPPGKIYPNGINLNGRNNYTLPGGKQDTGETVTQAAEREFQEETATNIVSSGSIEYQFSISYSAAYFKVNQQYLNDTLNAILTTNLVQAQQAQQEIINRTINKYSEIHIRYPNCPADNELQTVYKWNVKDPGNWKTIESWKNDPTIGWYYDILSYLKNDIL